MGLLRTYLFEKHNILKAKLVPFAGWEMPIQYTGIIDEVNVVRKSAGIFDVSHMGRIEITGDDAGKFLEKILTVSVTKMDIGFAKYCFILNENAGIIDDVVIYRISDDKYLMVCNASNKDPVLSWLSGLIKSFNDISLLDLTLETVMIALQGPSAFKILNAVLNDSNIHSDFLSNLDLFEFCNYNFTFENGDSGYSQISLISRTGYTGENGFEIIVPNGIGLRIWDELHNYGALPCGLGSRDVLRLEAGLRLHGNDIDQTSNPFQAGLKRFVDMENSSFIGHEELLLQNEKGIYKHLVGFRMLDKAIPRKGYLIMDSDKNIIGEVTSGSHSPTLELDIGMGYIMGSRPSIEDDIILHGRGRDFDARVTKIPFYRRSSN